MALAVTFSKAFLSMKPVVPDFVTLYQLPFSETTVTLLPAEIRL